MRAIVLEGNGVCVDLARPEPSPQPGEVLVRVLRAGICATDLQLVRGYKGFQGVLGHEFVGIPLEGELAGRRVVGEINCSCGRCPTCADGERGHCPSRTVIGILNHDGAFADLVAVPVSNLHPVPDDLDTDAAVFTEPVAAACRIPVQIPLRPSDRVVVLGDGRLGNLCAQVLRARIDDVTVVGNHPGKLRVLDALGIATCHSSERSALARADVVVDCTGSASGLPAALDLVRPRGTVILKTTIAGQQSLDQAPIVVDEVTIVGSRCGPFPQALDLLRSGRVRVHPLISARYGLADGAAALERAAEGHVLKVLLEMDS